MPEPWFNPAFAWLPGTLLGCFGGLLGGLAGLLAPQGKCKALVLGGWWLLLLASAAMLAAGVAGYLSDQPYPVWYGLGLAGLLGTVVLGVNLPVLARRYREAEERRLHAHDLT